MSDVLTRYPVLARLPEALRADYAAKGDAGLRLTADECAALGLARCESFVLQPMCGPNLMPDARTVFGGDVDGGIREILTQRNRETEEQRAKRESA